MKEYLMIIIGVSLLYVASAYIKARNKTNDRFSFWSSIAALVIFTAIFISGLFKKESFDTILAFSVLYVILVIYLVVKVVKSYKKIPK